MKPAVPITDPRFRYTPSHQTDIRKLFARVKREQQRGDPLNPADWRDQEKRK